MSFLTVHGQNQPQGRHLLSVCASLSRKCALPWKSCDVPVSKGQCHYLPPCSPWPPVALTTKPGLCALCLSSPAPFLKISPTLNYLPTLKMHLFFLISKILHSHLPLSLFTSPQVSDFTLKPASDWSCQPVFSVACPATWWLARALSLVLHQKKKKG